MFILKPTGSHYKHVWGDNDYVVLESGQVVGRIMLHSQAPEGRPWFWTITALEQPRSVYNHGYSASREQAMTDFKERWLAGHDPQVRDSPFPSS